MAFRFKRLVLLEIFIIFMTGFGSTLRVVIDPVDYSNTTEEMNISCITDGPTDLAKSIVRIQIMKHNEDKTIAVINMRQELKMGAGSKTNMKAEGHIDTADASKSHLTLTIDKPGRQDAGIYTCLMFYIDEDSNIVEERVIGNVIYRACANKGWTYYYGDQTCVKVFSFKDNALSWFKAKDACQAYGGNLVQIHDEDKNTFVYNLALESGSPFPWIGIKNNASVGFDFRYVNGTPLGTYQPWLPDNPSGDDDKDLKCVTMSTLKSKPGLWYDAYCYWAASFACSTQRN